MLGCCEQHFAGDGQISSVLLAAIPRELQEEFYGLCLAFPTFIPSMPCLSHIHSIHNWPCFKFTCSSVYKDVPVQQAPVGCSLLHCVPTSLHIAEVIYCWFQVPKEVCVLLSDLSLVLMLNGIGNKMMHGLKKRKLVMCSPMLTALHCSCASFKPNSD